MNSNRRGITLLEALVAVVVGLILIALTIPTIGYGLTKTPQEGELNNVRQLQMVATQIFMDATTTGEPVKWTCTNTVPLTLKQWYDLVIPSYMSANDMAKLMTYRAERKYWFPLVVSNAVNVYAVTETDPSNTVLFSTANWRGPFSSRLLNTVPLGGYFIIGQKGGNASLIKGKNAVSVGSIFNLQEKDCTNTALIGSGGMHNYLPLK